MSFLKSSKLRDVATIATATLATLGLASTNPAAAALFKIGFCGQFLNGDNTPIAPDTQVYPVPLNPLPNPPLNRVFPSYIIVDSTETGNAGLNFGIKDAKIQTQRVDLTPSLLNYNFSDFQSSALDSGIVRWTFETAGNIFNVRIPVSFLNDLPSLPTWSNTLNSEKRLNLPVTPVTDDFIVTPVPEPTSVLGTAIAIGLGGLLTKKNLSKLKKDKEIV